MNKQKNKKKVIAFLLSMLMLISLFQNISYTPVAEGGETESVATGSDAQSQVTEPYDVQSVSETGEDLNSAVSNPVSYSTSIPSADQINLSDWDNSTTAGVSIDYSVTITHDGKEQNIDDVTKIYDQDKLNIKYDWKFDNAGNGGVTQDGSPVYVKIDMNSLQNINLETDVVYPITDEIYGTTGYVYIKDGVAYVCINNENFLKSSDRAGTGIIHGNIDVDDKDNIKSGDKITIATGKFEYEKIYDDGTATSSLRASKSLSGSAYYDDATKKWKQNYKITLDTTGEVTEVQLSDIPGSKLGLDGEIEVSSSTDDNVSTGTKYASFEDMKQQITKLGKANGSTKVELSYTMTIADEGIFDSQSGSGDAYKNKLSYSYKDNKQTTTTPNTVEASYWVDRPSVSKNGTLNDNIVTWTIKIDLKDYQQEYSSLEEFLGATGSILDIPDAAGSVLCDSTGTPLTDGKLDASIFTDAGNGVYIATVYTKVTDDYMDSVAPAPVKNTVTVTNNQGYSYKGDGTVNTPGKNWTISKSAGGYDKTTGMITWSITFPDVPKGITNVLIDDDMRSFESTPGNMAYICNAKLQYKTADGTISSVNVTDENGAYVSNEIITSYTQGGTAEHQQYGYKFEFADSAFADDSTRITEMTLTYQTKVTDTDLDTVQRTFVNNATLNYTSNGVKGSTSSSAKYKNEIPPLNKTSVAGSTEGTIDYTLDIALNAFTLTSGTSIVIKDQLPTGMELVSSSVAAEYWAISDSQKLSLKSHVWVSPSYQNGSISGDVSISADTTEAGVTAFNVGVNSDMQTIVSEMESKGYTAHIYVTYTTKITDMESFAKGGEQSFTNTAQIYYNNAAVGEPVSNTRKLTPSPLVTKTGTFNGQPAAGDTVYNLAKYEIDVNANAYDLAEGDTVIAAVDTLGNAFIYDISTVKVYEVTQAGESLLTKGTDYKVVYDSTRNSLKFELPDNKHLRITYTAKCTLKAGETLTETNSGNTFSLSNYDPSHSGTTDFRGNVVVKSENSSSSDSGTVTLFKYWIDDEGNQQPLNGSTFELYKATWDGSVMSLNATPEQGTDVLKVTDEETGMLTISGLKHDQYYALVEKSAKDGFDVRVEPYYFVLPGTNNLRMPAGVEGKEFTADTGYILSYENKKATYYTGSFDFSATKQLDGTTAYASENTYIFKNFAVEEVSADVANATKVKDVTTGTTAGNATGAITFAGKASYSSATAGDVGTHYYKVYETSSGYTDVTTDANYYILTVDVALDDAANPTKLVATCSKITKYNSAGTGTTASEVVFNNTTVTTTIQGTKSWVGDTTADRPASIQVRLYKLKQGGNENDDSDWEQVGAVRTVDAASAWKYSFGTLPKYYPGTGTEISYKVVETSVAGYTTSYPAGTYDIVNTMIQTSGSITFTALKKLDNATNYSANYTFAGFAVDELNADLTTKTAEVATGTTKGSTNGTVTFTPLTYDSAVTGDVGEHIYKIYEKESGYTGVTKDDTYYVVKVNVTKNTVSNKLDAAVTSVQKYVNGAANGSAGTSLGTVIFENTTDKTSVSGTKTWVDTGYEAYRPSSIELNLYRLKNGTTADWEYVATKSLSTTETTKSFTFDNLDKYYAGTNVEIQYKVEETPVSGYTTKYATNGYDITNTLQTTKVTIRKDWDDNNDADRNRPLDLKVSLMENGVSLSKDITLTAANNWTASWDNLPVYKNGVEIKYSVVEDAASMPPAYSQKSSVIQKQSDGTYLAVITNQYSMDKVSHTVTKVWEDDNNRDGLRTPIMVQLKADGVAVTDPDAKQELNETNHWTYTWNDLDKQNAAGKNIVYTVEEVGTVTGYTTAAVSAGSTTTITNTHTARTRDITVNKVWADNNSTSRPTSVDVQLYANGFAVGAVVTLNAANNWAYTWTKLPYNEAGQEIVYTVKEVAVPQGYGVSYSPMTVDTTTGNGSITVTNSYPSTTRTVTKVWDDQNNQDRKRPTSIQVKLKYDGKVYDTVTLSETNHWTYTWTELPKYSDVAAGTEYVYTVEEVDVPAGYTESYVKKDASGTTVTADDAGENGVFEVRNSYTTQKGDIAVEKKWDGDSLPADDHSAITVTLYKNGVATTKTLQLDKTNNWKGTFTDLDKYENGVEISYSVKETDVENYVTSYTPASGSIGETIVVTNTYAPTKLVLTKTVAGGVSKADAEKTIRFEVVEDATGTKTTYSLADFAYDTVSKTWTKEISCNAGSYTVNEIVSDVDGYTLSKVTYVIDAQTPVEGKTASVVIVDHATANIAYTNTYDKVTTETTEVTTTEETTTEETTTEEITTEVTTTEITTTTEVTTTTTTTTTSSTTETKTGDAAPIAPITVVMIVAAAGIIVLGVRKKKQNDK